MAEELLTQLGAAASLLRLLRADKGDRAEASKSEATKVCARLHGGVLRKLTPTQRQQILVAVETASFEAADNSRIVAALSQNETAQDDGKQSWAINNLLTKTVSEQMTADVGSAHIVLVRYLVGLGLWAPSESTLQLISAVLMLNADDVPTTPRAKNHYLKACRQWWANYRGVERPPIRPSIINTPQDLKRHNVEAFNSNFGDGVVHNPFKLSDIANIVNGNWMRWHKSRDTVSTPAVSAPGALDINSVGTLLNFVQQIQGMQYKEHVPDLKIYGHGRKRIAPEEDTWEGYAPYQPQLANASETCPPRRDADQPRTPMRHTHTSRAVAVLPTPVPLIDIAEHTSPAPAVEPLRDTVEHAAADAAALNILRSLKARRDSKAQKAKAAKVVATTTPTTAILDLMSTIGLREEVNVAHGPVTKAPGRPRSPIPWPFLFF